MSLNYRVLWAACFAVPLLQGDPVCAQMTYEQLRELAARAVSKQLVWVDPPSIEVDGETLHCNLGGVEWSYVGWDAEGSKYSAFLTAQMQIEVLRQHLTRPQYRNFWDPYLRKAERILADALDDFHSAADEEARRTAAEKAFTVYEVLDASRQDYAARHGLRLRGHGAAQNGSRWSLYDGLNADPHLAHLFSAQVQIEGLRQQAAKSALASLSEPCLTFATDVVRYAAFEYVTLGPHEQDRSAKAWLSAICQAGYQRLPEGHVSDDAAPVALQKRQFKVETVPRGAEIWLVPALEAEVAKIERRKPIWKVLTQEDAAVLAGSYWYFLKWSDGEVSGPKLTSIDPRSEGVVRLR